MELKKSLAALFIFIAIMAFNNDIFAQKYFKGYVITLKGDTTAGQIESPKKQSDMYNKIKYRLAKGKPIKNFTPEKLKGYGMDTLVFLSTVIEDEPIFVKQLLKGTYNLYIGYTSISEGLPDYFYEKDGKITVIQDKPKQFKKQLVPIMSDKPEIVKAIESGKYDFESVVDLFKAYNK